MTGTNANTSTTIGRSAPPAAEVPLLSGSLPVVGHIAEFARNPENLIFRGVREEGKLFRLRLGPDRVIVLLGRENNRFFFSETDRMLTLKNAYPFMASMFGPDFWFEATHQEYLRQRAVVLPRFAAKTVRTYINDMVMEVRELERRMGASGRMDLVNTMGPLVLRIAGRSFLGREFSNGLLGRDFFELFRRLSAGMELILPPHWPWPHMVRSRRARRELQEILGGLIERRQREPLDPPDFLQILAGARFADGGDLSVEMRVNMILLFIWAGQETTTGHVSWGFIDLLRRPAMLERAVAQAHEVLGGVEEITHEHVRRLDFIDRALHETERLHPVALAMRRKAVTDFEHGGFHFRRGDQLMIFPGVSHRLPDEYPRPHRFHPDRYLDDPRSKMSLAGFGGGGHRCLGVNFAYLEMNLIVAMLLRDYEMELIDPPKPVAGMKTRWPASPCRVRYRRRS